MQGPLPCCEIVQQIQATRAAAGARIPYSSTAAYCQARAKLSMKRLNQINEALLEKLAGTSGHAQVVCPSSK